MIEPTYGRVERRSNRPAPPPAMHPSAPATGDVWPASARPNLLARLAKAAQDAAREVRHPADMPLPHLYRGRDSRKQQAQRTA